MGLILRDLEGYSSQVKALERKISRLQATIASLKENRVIKRQTYSSHLVVSMEIEANVSETKCPSAREMELESALENALAESNKLRKRLGDTQKTQLELRKKINMLEK